MDDENFQWVADPSGGSGNFTSLASGSKNTIDVTDDGSGNFTIDVGQDEITATELAAGSVQRQHLHLETGITDGQALGYDSSTQRIQGLDIPDVSDYAALAGADFTGAVSIASSTTDSALTVTQTGNADALVINQSQNQNALQINQTGAAQGLMVVQSGDQSALEVRQPDGNSETSIRADNQQLRIAQGLPDNARTDRTPHGRRSSTTSAAPTSPDLALGPGGSGRDTNIFRDAANVLMTSDSFTVVGSNLTVNGTSTLTGAATFTALPTIPQTPTADTHAASKGYVDDNFRKFLIYAQESDLPNTASRDAGTLVRVVQLICR